MAKPIGERIRDRRKYLHMNQETLAKKSHISRTRLSMIENGKCNDLLVSTLNAIANALDITADFFLS